MYTKIFTCVIVVASILLAACGPRDIGTGTSSETSYEGAYTGGRGLDPDDLRHAMTGANSIQQRLYHYNRPAVMLQKQEWQKQLLRNTGQEAGIGRKGLATPVIDPASPAYRDTPKQKSPFRQ